MLTSLDAPRHPLVALERPGSMLFLFSIRMAVLDLEPAAPRHGCSGKAVLCPTDDLGIPLDIFRMDDGAALNANAPPADRRSIAEACVCCDSQKCQLPRQVKQEYGSDFWLCRFTSYSVRRIRIQ